MINNQNLKNRKKLEKAVAFLALNADKEVGQDRCLLPEEMASLVDMRGDKEELAIFMQHLSHCQKCYGEWLTLKKMETTVKPHTGESRVYRFNRFKKYSFIGSALAVAASVAVFLNISSPPHFSLDKTSEEVVPMPSKSEPAVPQFILENKGMDVESEKEQALPPVQIKGDIKSKERLEKPEFSVDTSDGVRQSAKGSASSLIGTMPRSAKKAMPAEVAGVGDMSMDADSWLEQLQKGCLSGRQDADFWSEMRQQGELILEKHIGSLVGKKEIKVKAALALLGKMDKQSVANQCRELLDILAEEGESR